MGQLNPIDDEIDHHDPYSEDHDGGQNENMISYLAGTIDQDFKHKFERLIFRTTRNTCQVFMEDLEYREGSDLAKSAEIDENGNMVTKSFFVIMYVGGM